MTAISVKYTDDEREAMGAAMAGGMRARQVIEHAAAGTLVLDGSTVEPFTIASESTVRDQAARYRRRRAGQARSALADGPPRDAIENLRQRLVNVADAELRVIERQKAGTVNMERLRQAIRCVREAAAIPGRDEPRPAPPGQRDPSTGEHNGGRTQGGLGGQILASHYRTVADPAPEPVAPPEPPARPEPEPAIGSDEWRRVEGQKLAARVEARLRASAESPSALTLPTAMSAPSQLADAAEHGWDPLHPPPSPEGRGRRARAEDT